MIRTLATSGGTTVYLGKNAQGNHYLCANSEHDTYWLHLQDHASPHAILCTHIHDKASLVEAATFVKQYSKLKNEKKVKVIYCKLENIQMTKTPGLVRTKKNPDILII